jgi:hypothetical protein
MNGPDPDYEARCRRIDAMFEGKPVAPPKLVPGGYPVELFERADRGDEGAVDQIAEYMHKGAVELLRRGRGSILATAYVFCRYCPKGSGAIDPLYTTSIVVPDAHNDSDVKNSFAMLVHGIALIGQARAVSFVMEAWRVSPKPGDPPPSGSFEFVPGRDEIVNVTLETQTIKRVWSGEITRYGRNGFVVAPFEKWPASVHVRGRFFGVMQPGYDPVVAGARPKEDQL